MVASPRCATPSTPTLGDRCGLIGSLRDCRRARLRRAHRPPSVGSSLVERQRSRHDHGWYRCSQDSYTLVAIDEVGKRVAALTVPARKAGHIRILEWLDEFGMVKVAVEDCRHLTRALEASLLLAGHQVLRVHTRLMAGMRRSSREPGKSDPIDAEAVARVALREDDLPDRSPRRTGSRPEALLRSPQETRRASHRVAGETALVPSRARARPRGPITRNSTGDRLRSDRQRDRWNRWCGRRDRSRPARRHHHSHPANHGH